MRFLPAQQRPVLSPRVVGCVLGLFGLAWFAEGLWRGEDRSDGALLALVLGFLGWRLGARRAARAAHEPGSLAGAGEGPA